LGAEPNYKVAQANGGKGMKTARSIRFGLGSLCMGLLLGAVPAFANLTTYGTFGAWSGAVSGITTVTIPEPDGGYAFFGSGNGSVTYGGVTFTASSALGNGYFFNVGNCCGASPAVLSDQQATSGVENILITFPTAVSAFAMNYGTFNGSNVTFSTGADSTTQGTVGSGYAVPQFLGATSSTPFNSVLVTSPDFVMDINNVSFGNAATPEPSFYAVLGLGLIGLAYFGIRRRRTA
jgi:hypothetical protein